VLTTLAVASSVIVTGAAPQANVTIPPAATAATTAADVQLAGLPVPTTRVGCEVSTARASAGTLACPAGVPAVPPPVPPPGAGAAGRVTVVVAVRGGAVVPARSADAAEGIGEAVVRAPRGEVAPGEGGPGEGEPAGPDADGSAAGATSAGDAGDDGDGADDVTSWSVVAGAGAPPQPASAVTAATPRPTSTAPRRLSTPATYGPAPARNRVGAGPCPVRSTDLGLP